MNIVNTSRSNGKSFLPGYLEVQSLSYKLIERLSAELGKTPSAVYNRLRGTVKINALERPVIEKVFAELVPGIDPWTGERTQPIQ